MKPEVTSPEMGRELRPNDLKPRQIVVIVPPGFGVGVSMWVVHVNPKHVVFRAAAVPGFAGSVFNIVNFVRDDGALVDDQGRRVWVFEYLGDP